MKKFKVKVMCIGSYEKSSYVYFGSAIDESMAVDFAFRSAELHGYNPSHISFCEAVK